MWVGERSLGAGRSNGIGALVREPARADVQLSRDGLAAQETKAADNETDPLAADWRMTFLKRMIEALTGRPIRTLRMEDLQRSSAAAEPPVHPPPEGNRSAAPGHAGFGVEYDFRASYQEYERTTFQAEGVVQTTDGREIGFSLHLSMERAYSESVSMQLRRGDARMKDPLVLDFAGPAAALSKMRFSFDLDANGQSEAIPLLGGGRGYLAIDRNDNGRIDDGNELFGPTSGDGFAELASLDGDESGWIDESDLAFSQLRVWTPAAEGEGRLQTAAEAGVGALYPGRVATPFDLRSASNDTLGIVRSSGIYLRDDGTVGTVSQIDLSIQRDRRTAGNKLSPRPVADRARRLRCMHRQPPARRFLPVRARPHQGAWPQWSTASYGTTPAAPRWPAPALPD